MSTATAVRSRGLSRPELEGARRFALSVDLFAVGASMAANIVAAPASLGGWLVAVIAPLGLFLSIGLWHRSRGILRGPLGWLFSTGLAAVGSGAAVVSFGHLRHVAEVNGQTGTAAVILPLVVDATAVLATIVVVAAGQRLAESEAADAQAAADAELAERQAVEAERRAEAERLAALETAEREAAERERLARIEAEREAAELERVRLEAATEADRLAIAAAEQATAAAEAQRARSQLLEAAKASADESTGDGSPSPYGAATGLPSAERIELYLADHPDATRSAVASACELDPSTVKRSPAWRSHREARNSDPATGTVQATEVAAA